MRLLVKAVVLVGALGVVAQTQVVDIPAQKPAGVPNVPVQRPGARRPGVGATPVNATTEMVPPNTPVVTLQGVCKEHKTKGACETVITRDDLDKYAAASSQEPSAARGRIAVQYARTLAFSSLAEQEGLEKNPVLAKEIELQLKIVRMRMLASAYLQTLQNQTTSIAEPDIQKYYDEHKDQYEQARVLRLSVPIAVPTEAGRPLDRAAVKTEMEDIRTRALAGEDLNQLQQDAYKHLHIQAAPPPVNALTMRRGNVQGDEAKAFDLKPGEISAVLDLPAAFVVVKLESKDLLPFASVRPEIEGALRRGHMQDETSKLSKKISTQFNLQYLELPSQPDIFGMTAITPVTGAGRLRRAPRARR